VGQKNPCGRRQPDGPSLAGRSGWVVAGGARVERNAI
jgi:hypothetical protein